MLLQITDAPPLTGDNKVDLLNYMVWIGGGIITALLGGMYLLWNKWNKDKDAHAEELKSERDYIREQEKENIKLFNKITSVIDNIFKGIDKELPKTLEDIKSTINERAKDIKEHISDLKKNG